MDNPVPHTPDIAPLIAEALLADRVREPVKHIDHRSHPQSNGIDDDRV
ncbi:MAG: hypothetical protein SO046_09440 [Actinomyces urogenitalis]|nr:hypothetical protein [Actinomyces urogenitalis]MDY3679418.1 hypothetical protein [Actinomyces urogenitalis]